MQGTASAPSSTVVSGCFAASAGILAVVLLLVMVFRINRHLPQDEHITSLRDCKDARQKYKRLYPKTRLVLLLDACIVFFILFLVVLFESVLF